MFAPSRQPSKQGRPADATAQLRSRLPWPIPRLVLPLAYYVAVTAVLAFAGYPSWRIAVVALAALGQQLAFVSCPKRDILHCVNADPDQLASFVVRAQSSLIVTTSLAVAVTGGVHSPLLITFIISYVAAVAIVGDRRPTRRLLAATSIGIGVLSLLPGSITGPALASSAHGLLTAIGVLGVGALLAPVHATARKKRDQLARAREQLACDALARVQNLEQVGAKVAHELKNPLTGVKALVQLGLRNAREAPSHDRLEVVDREVTRMQDILQNYLSFTRPLQAVRPTRVELGPLVSDTLEVLSARADDASVRLFAHGDATLEADPRRLKEALMNLVANAIEATPPGGDVVVEVRPDGDNAQIIVRDTGRGMPADTLTRIGTPFFTTRDDGTGLGVVLARSVIAEHGGALRYESEPGKGTSVWVTLPRVATGVRDGASAARR